MLHLPGPAPRRGKRQRPKEGGEANAPQGLDQLSSVPGGRGGSLDRKSALLHALLQQTKADVHQSKSGTRVSRKGTPLLPEVEKISGDEYFLLLFYEHVSYRPRAHVDLSGWGSELRTEVSRQPL